MACFSTLTTLLGCTLQISNSPAFQFLEELLSAGKLTGAQAQLYRSKYSKLHDVVLKTYENEKNLLKKAKQLNQDLSAERAKLEKAAAAAQEDSETIASLRTEVTKGDGELSMREERELMLQQELIDLQGVRNELQSEVTATKKKQVCRGHPISGCSTGHTRTALDLAPCARSAIRGAAPQLVPPSPTDPIFLVVVAQMAELQPRIDEVETALAEVKAESERQHAQLTKLQQDHEALKERALVRIRAKWPHVGRRPRQYIIFSWHFLLNRMPASQD